MIWIPVLFICTVSGDCGFVFNDGYPTERECVSKLETMIKEATKDPQIRGAKGGCLDVKTTGGKNSV